MKLLIPIAVLLLLIIVATRGCERQRMQYKAQGMVMRYMKAHLDDISAYEPISFSQIKRVVPDSCINKTYDEHTDDEHTLKYQITHVYEIKSALSGLRRDSDWFYIDPSFTKVISLTEFAEKEKTQK